MHPYVNIGIKAALSAGKVIMRYFNELDQLSVIEKKPNDFVCDADIYAEQNIIQTIKDNFPKHTIISEEAGEIPGEENTTWIIDPLDGTSNYLHNLPHFAVSIAVKQGDRIEHGIIYDPVRNELFTASHGRGAQLNDRRIRVSQQYHLKQAFLGTGFPFKDPTISEQYFATYQLFLNQCLGVRRSGSTVLDFAYVAAGRLDVAWEVSLKLWDFAAGILLVREAGGLISDFKGGEDFIQTGEIIAGNRKILKSVLKSVQSKINPNV